MITYGNGIVLIDEIGKAFQIKYNGSFKITNSDDNLFISVSDKLIIGFTLNGDNMNEELFSYEGDLRILSCKIATTNNLVHQRINLQGVDYWENYTNKFTLNRAKWDEQNGTYQIGEVKNYSRHDMVVNNNIKVETNNQYQYEDGTFVPANTLIHIHGDGVAMTGGVHSESSVTIYPSNKSLAKSSILLKPTQSTTTSTTTTTTTSSTSSGGGY